MFDDYIYYCIPFHFRSSITTTLIDNFGLSDDIAYSNSKTVDNFQYYLTARSPTTLDWTAAYHQDSNTRIIIANLQTQKVPSWLDATLNQLTPKYCLHLKQT